LNSTNPRRDALRKNPEWRERERAYERARRRVRYEDETLRQEKNAKLRAWRAGMTEAQKAKQREAMLARHRRRLASDPAYKAAHRAHQLRNTAKRRGAIGAGEAVQRAFIFERDKGVCHLCGLKVKKAWVLDHVIPLAAGGSHTKANLALAHASCNARKGANLTHLF